ncbi:MAG: GC-type dockerin domain-anchored protein [Planctomycetota bacterium]|nr:GC-type dockerin domain-anchored protein [Planctomycetota bacterium]
MRMGSMRTAQLLALAAGSVAASVASGQVFVEQNFNGAVLDQQSGDPTMLAACLSSTPFFTHVPPAGWTVNNCGVPTYACRFQAECNPTGNCLPENATPCADQGVFEWEGWSFARKELWSIVAGNQQRSAFTLGTNIVAIADPDEWDDRGNPDAQCGLYNTFMSTPAIDVQNANLSTLSFNFASSFRSEGNQTALLRVYYTDANGVENPSFNEVLRFESDANSPFFKPDNLAAWNEAVSIPASTLNIPAGTRSVRFEFGLVNAVNNWWWAVDNLVLQGQNLGGQQTSFFTETFESVTLQPPVHEGASGAPCAVPFCGQNVYTHTGPDGWSVSLTNPPAGGVPDWRGWSFTTRPFWNCVEGNGTGFTGSSGIIAVADNDAFDDLPDGRPLDTSLTSPAIDISGRSADLIVLSFRSSWRWEAAQTATVTARYDTGQVVEILRWESNPSSTFFKGDAVNEQTAVPLLVPTGASTVSIEYRLVGSNNWWWAIDDVRLFEGAARTSIFNASPTRDSMSVSLDFLYPACFTPWTPTPPTGWTNVFDPIGCVSPCGVEEWRGWSFADRDYWIDADFQNREQFTKASGFVAVADNDEWDDAPNGNAQYNTFLTTPSIALPAGATAQLNFDSSWRPEGFDDFCVGCPGGDLTNNQTAIIEVNYFDQNGSPISSAEILRWDSNPNGSFFKPDSTNESVSINLAGIPANARSMTLEFNQVNARNDWWWAIDNIDVKVNGGTTFAEDFNNLTNDLRAPAGETPPEFLCQYFSTVIEQPGSFTSETTNTTCAPAFAGWNAWVIPAWAQATPGGSRNLHGAATAFVSDFAARDCDGVATLTSPTYDISIIAPGTLELSFRSGWLSQAGHISTVEASFDGGTTWTNVLTWNPGNKTTNADEVVTVGINNPQGATSARIRFVDQDAGWWAVSDLALTGELLLPTCPADFNDDGQVDFFDYLDFVGAFGVEDPSADFNADGQVDFFDYLDFSARFGAGC